MLKSYLDEKGISYVEKLTDQDQAIQEEMSSISGGFLGVPFTVIEKPDGSKENVIGFDKNKINSIVGL